MPAETASAARPWGWIIVILAALGLLIAFPPFRIVSKKDVSATVAGHGAAAFNAADFVDRFWREQLQPAATRARDSVTLLADLRRDPVAAARVHGLRVGLGNTVYYFVRGSGRVVALERNRLLIEIDGAVVGLRTGPVFGNGVRDGCGLLEVNQVPGLAEFNAVSSEINRLVEERVLPRLRDGMAVGLRLTFAGCAEAPETLPVSGPLLMFTPVHVEVSP